MEISKRHTGGAVEVVVAGRIDGYWSDHLASAIDEEIRLGSHHVSLDLSEVVFLSSAGIGMLVRFYKSLNSIQGSLSIARASDRVRKVIEICGLQNVLLTSPGVQDATKSEGARPAAEAKPFTQIERAGTVFEVYELDSDAGIRCRAIGDPSLLKDCGFGKENCRTMEFSDSSFALGLGALGESFEECQNRFGEFIAVAGAVAYRPTDGTNMPDYLVAAGQSRPEVQVCYGLACDGLGTGPFSKLVRFQAAQDSGAVTLADVVESCLEFSGSTRVGIVMIAEAAGLMGAALRHSPAQTVEKTSLFELPHVREWLTFTAERAHTRSMTMVVGVAARDEGKKLTAQLRPMTSSTESRANPISGHFHAAAFSYRPLQKGKLDLKTTVKKLFEGQTLENVLHLLSDDRAIAGAGQSEFIRGACWIGPMQEIASEGDEA
jgi:anti-anti-sigma factor